MHINKTISIKGFLITIEQRPFILDGNIQPVYRYFIDGILVLTYYTNGQTENLYPVYHELGIWPKAKIDELLADADLLPLESSRKIGKSIIII